MTLPALPPNAIDLTYLAAVKNRAVVESPTDDPEIQAAITAFSQWLLYYTGEQTLNSVGTYTETYNGNGNQRLFLRQRPVLNVTAVTVNNVGIPQSGGFGSWGYFVEDNAKSIAVRGGLGNFSTFPYPNYYGTNLNKIPAFQKGVGNIVVQYSAGYPPTTVHNDVETIASNTVTLAYGPWVADAGVVYYPSLTPLVLVPSAPNAGQYAVSNGLYVFANADNGAQVAVSYQINRAPYDLEYAVRCVVAINYKRKGWQDQASKGTTAGGTSATTRYMNWDWPPEYEKVFRHYQRLSVT